MDRLPPPASFLLYSGCLIINYFLPRRRSGRSGFAALAGSLCFLPPTFLQISLYNSFNLTAGRSIVNY